jgi:ubiquinone/menaquinone biosynthesis C-methylase UbiE
LWPEYETPTMRLMAIDDSYAEIAPFYDLEFDEFQSDVELYLGYAQLVGGPVLELGCGTGRLLEPLVRSGYSVTGLDNSEAMTERALTRLRDAGLSDRAIIVTGDMRDLQGFETDAFRLVFIAINSFLHLHSRADQLQTLTQIRRVLHRDGLLVIDVFNPTPETLTRMDDHYTFDAEWTLDSGSTVQRYSHRQLDSSEQRITTRLFYDLIALDGTVTRRTTSYVMRYVHRFELESLLSEAEFELEGIYGSYSIDPLEHDSDQLIAVSHRTPKAGEM